MKKGIKIQSTEYLENYTIRFIFSDGRVNIFDYANLVRKPINAKYLDISEFKKFEIIEGSTEIAWGEDWDMLLPLQTIYSKTCIGKVGAKPKTDKVLCLRLYAKESVIVKQFGNVQNALSKLNEIISKY